MREYTREEARADGIKRSNKALRNLKIAERSLRLIEGVRKGEETT